MEDILLYSQGAKQIAIEDPSFRFYLNLVDMGSVRKRVHVRKSDHSYDVALSFAGEDRPVVMKFVEAFKVRGLDVFYDFDQQAKLWGQDLRKKLSEVYASDSLYMLVFLSQHYPEKDWPSFEFSIGKDAAAKRTEEYLLPVRLDDTIIVGLKDSVGYLDARKMTPEEIAAILAQKVDHSEEQRPESPKIHL
jgi:hypothetical protein